MVSTAICLHQKFGHCKYGQKCRLKHVTLTCDKADCELHVCELRHPSPCRYFSLYGNCKFGTYCSFSHIVTEKTPLGGNLEEYDFRIMKEKLASMEKRLDEKDAQVEILETEVDLLKSENLKIKLEIQTLLDQMKSHTETAIKNTVDAVIGKLTSAQIDNETRTDRQLKALETQVSQLVNLIKSTSPSTRIRPKVAEEQPVNQTHLESRSLQSNR